SCPPPAPTLHIRISASLTSPPFPYPTLFRSHKVITVDTEFLRETTYYPLLCVVQMASADEAVVVDALAPGIDLKPFFELMSNERSEEHTSELQSRFDLVCRLLLDKKKIQQML